MSTIASESVRHEPHHRLHFEILYNGIEKRIEIDPDVTVKTLLDRAIALFGNIPQAHTLALWTERGVELTNEKETLEAAHLKNGESLILRPGAVKGGN